MNNICNIKCDKPAFKHTLLIDLKSDNNYSIKQDFITMLFYVTDLSCGICTYTYIYIYIYIYYIYI